jgi:hypothetical protein
MANLFRQGEHICAVFETEEQYLAIAAEYVADGLSTGEQVLYVCQSDAAVERFHVALEKTGIDVDAARKSRALVESTHAQAHLVDNRFDSERMLTLLNEAVEAALNGGFTGLRACGDMSWLLVEPEGAEQAVAYEAFLNQFFRGVRACGMCLYDRRRLPSGVLDQALATHSSVVIDGHHRSNPFYRPLVVPSVARVAPEDVNWKFSALRQQP